MGKKETKNGLVEKTVETVEVAKPKQEAPVVIEVASEESAPGHATRAFRG
jgi:hypothetical protein